MTENILNMNVMPSITIEFSEGFMVLFRQFFKPPDVPTKPV